MQQPPLKIKNKVQAIKTYFCSADTLIATVLFALALPVCLIIGLAVRIKLGNPVFYKGLRLGKNKQLFNIYKFRTLPNNAQKELIGAELLSTKHGLTTPFTEFLRDTRLDELPQLWNVIRGDMGFIGPRPERPEIYEVICRKIQNYDKRFLVKPGLLGYSQLFTPHGTPKRMRTLVDNAYIHRENSFLAVLGIILYAFVIVCQRILMRLAQSISEFVQRKILKRYEQKRRKSRQVLAGTVAHIATQDNTSEQTEMIAGHLVNINEEAFLIYTNQELPSEEELIYHFTIPNIKRKRSHVPYKTAKCKGYMVRKLTPNDKNYQFGYVIFYETTSPFNTYLIEQYILHTSLAY